MSINAHVPQEQQQYVKVREDDIVFFIANDDNKFNYFGMWLEQNRIYYKILIDMVEYFQDMQVNIIEKYPFWIYA
jgi:hypothetical protein